MSKIVLYLVIWRNGTLGSSHHLVEDLPQVKLKEGEPVDVAIRRARVHAKRVF